MDLIERYLQAIRRNLPRSRQDDVIAELRDDLLSRIEDREAALGRTLGNQEVELIVRETGHPLVVAARFGRHQWLIGPDVFPFYLFTLRIVLLVVAAVILAWAFVSIAFMAADPVSSALQAVGQLFMYGLINGGIVTFVFAILERTGFPAEHLDRWTPDQLPDLGDDQPGPWKAAIEVALTIAFLLWWIEAVSLPLPPGGEGFRIEGAAIWKQLYLPILLLISARLAHNLVQWLRPRWVVVRGILGAATGFGALALLAIVYKAGEWAVVVAQGIPPEQALRLQESLNLALGIAIIAVSVVWLLGCLAELWKLSQNLRERAA